MPRHVHRQELLVPRQWGKCIVIDCYKRLPSQEALSYFRTAFDVLKRCTKKVPSAPHIHADMQFAKQLPCAVV